MTPTTTVGVTWTCQHLADSSTSMECAYSHYDLLGSRDHQAKLALYGKVEFFGLDDNRPLTRLHGREVDITRNTSQLSYECLGFGMRLPTMSILARQHSASRSRSS